MRITEVLLRPAIGGAETLVAQLSRHWQTHGHTVTTVYVDPDGAPRGRRDRITTLTQALRETEPDAVHAHSALPNLYARLASRGRWPVVTVLHSAENDFDDRTLRITERLVSRWTAHVVAVSDTQVQEYRNRFGDRGRVTLIPNGVRADIIPRTTPRSHLARAVAISRLDAQKRIDVLLEGWRRADLSATLKVAGVASDPETQANVEKWSAAVPSARLIGRVDDVPALLAESDILVHAADAEAHPLAPIEAACAGLPVVVSTAVAATLPEHLVKVTFPTGDPAGLAVAMHEAAESYAQLSERAVCVAPRLMAEFSLSRCADLHLRLLSGHARPGGRASQPTSAS